MPDRTPDASDRAVWLSPDARAAIVSHARQGAPEEVCGVLGGDAADADASDDGPGRPGDTRVTAVERVPNVASARRTRYELDPEAQLEALDGLEEDSFDVVGFYHSHPRGPAAPSATDRAAATWPGYRYLIVTLAGDEPAIGAWLWTGESFEREDVRVDGK